MRELKFKFWNKIDKGFVKCKGWNGNFTINEMFANMNKYNIFPLQYTGLKDKNGIEIYEGDLVKGKYISEVIFEKGAFVLSDWDDKLSDLSEHIEVIGNIYENPELSPLK